MKKDILVSVIMPAYNTQDTIKRSIDSVLLQSYDNYELIIVVDGATDSTYDICKEMQIKNNKIKLFYKENGGALWARNMGVSKAKGDYLLFLDADDTIEKDAIEKLVDIALKSDSDLIRYRYKKIPENYVQDEYFKNEDIVTINKEDFKTKVYPFFLKGYMLNTLCTDFVKRKFFKVSDENNKRLSYAEDLKVNLDIFTNVNKVTFVSYPLYNYITRNNSTTRTKSITRLMNNLKDCIKVYMSFYDYLKIWGMNDKENVEYVSTRILSEIASLLLRIDNAKENEDENFSSLRNEILEILNNEEIKFVIDNAKKIDEFKNHKAYSYMQKLIAKDFNNII